MAWIAAAEAVTRASIALEELGDLLRERAGITEPSPARRLTETSVESLELALTGGPTESALEDDDECGDAT